MFHNVNFLHISCDIEKFRKDRAALRGQSFSIDRQEPILSSTDYRNYFRKEYPSPEIRFASSINRRRAAISRISANPPIKINVKSNCRSILFVRALFIGAFCGERAPPPALEHRNLESTYAR